MWPLLRPGDVARVEPLAGPPRAGDILVYVDHQARLVAHRMIDELPDGRLRLRGDFTFTPDPPVELRRIVGRLTSVERVGRGTVALDGPVGRALAFALPRLERAAPRALAGLRRSVLAAAALADGVWTAGPVRRFRRRRHQDPRPEVAAAGPGDMATLLAHVRAQGRDPRDFEGAGAAGGSRAVALARGPTGVLAFALARRVPDGPPDWQLADVHVAHRWRGLGLGRATTLAVLQVIQERDASAPVQVVADARTRRADRFLRSLGFRPEPAAPGQACRPTGADVRPMRLALSLPPTRPAHIVAALCRTPSRS